MKTKLSKSGIAVGYSEHIKKVIKKIQKGEIPTAKELDQALSNSVDKVLQLDAKEKALFEEYLGTEAGEFKSNSPVKWTDVDGYIKYYNDEDKYEVGYKGTRPTTIGLKLLEQWYPYTDIDTKKKQVRILRKLQAVSAKIDKLTNAELSKLGFGSKKAASKEDFNMLIEMAAADKELDITVSSDVISGLSIGKGTMKVTTELKLSRAYKGSLSRVLRDRVNELFTHYSEKNGAALEDLTKDINIAKPFRNNIEKSLTSVILNTKMARTRKKAVDKATKKMRSKSGAKAQIARNNRKKITKPKISYEESLFNIRAIINAALASQVAENMGDASDPAIKLRYQTGRFSESAKMITLTRQQSGKLLGAYTYMRYPYDVFLPGGRLNPPVERDPRLYIEQSIRQLAVSLFKGNYPGIDLELL